MHGRAARKATTTELVARAYDLDVEPRRWFARMVGMFRCHLDTGHGVFGVLARVDRPAVLHAHLERAHPITRHLIYLGAPLVLRRAPPAFVAATSSDLFGVRPTLRFSAPFGTLLPALDCAGLWGVDGAGLRIMIGSSRTDAGRARPVEHRLARGVLPHVAAALRLRRSLTGLGLDTASAEAIFDSNGRCMNAQGMGEPASAREALRQAVLRMERDRACSSDEDAREALLDGRWSLVDRFESDGRRFIVAYRNPPGVLDPRRLSARERDVAARIAQGKSHGAVAGELGISASTVGSVAMAVVNKLGLGSARELPLFWRDAAGDPVALGREEAIAIEGVTPPAAVPQLTPAEREVLEDVIRGGSNREIAARRRASVRTVANQVAGLLKKLGAASRLELAAKSPWDERGRA